MQVGDSVPSCTMQGILFGPLHGHAYHSGLFALLRIILARKLFGLLPKIDTHITTIRMQNRHTIQASVSANDARNGQSIRVPVLVSFKLGKHTIQVVVQIRQFIVSACGARGVYGCVIALRNPICHHHLEK